MIHTTLPYFSLRAVSSRPLELLSRFLSLDFILVSSLLFPLLSLPRIYPWLYVVRMNIEQVSFSPVQLVEYVNALENFLTNRFQKKHERVPRSLRGAIDERRVDKRT